MAYGSQEHLTQAAAYDHPETGEPIKRPRGDTTSEGIEAMQDLLNTSVQVLGERVSELLEVLNPILQDEQEDPANGNNIMAVPVTYHSAVHNRLDGQIKDVNRITARLRAIIDRVDL